ncbi:MAG: hypothetical protein H6822_21860 [Planctomycetaceae bacterium]|nr:hypothetical protein [Planctomycetales bacterium]MCB9924842.1 hypothetical protein [Planctomycetaceae bacterium]
MRILLAVIFVLGVSTDLQANELVWHSDYGAALELARSSERPMLLVISRGNPYAEASRQSAAGQRPYPAEEALKSYVLCRVDANSEHGQRVAKAFQVSEYPHSVVIDRTTTRILYRKTGPFTKETWAAMVTRYQHKQPLVEVTAPQTRTQPAARIQSRPTTATFFFRQPANCNT